MRRPHTHLRVAAAVALMVALGVSPASAVTTTGTKTVSCDGSTEKELGSVWSGGDFMMFRQLSASPAGSSVVRVIRFPEGTVMSSATYATGGSKSWSNFNAGEYLFRARRSAAANCNGVSPGHGNYSMDFLVQY